MQMGPTARLQAAEGSQLAQAYANMENEASGEEGEQVCMVCKEGYATAPRELLGAYCFCTVAAATSQPIIAPPSSVLSLIPTTAGQQVCACSYPFLGLCVSWRHVFEVSPRAHLSLILFWYGCVKWPGRRCIPKTSPQGPLLSHSLTIGHLLVCACGLHLSCMRWLAEHQCLLSLS